MKKYLVLVLMAAMTIGITACGSSSNTENTEIETTVEESTSSEVNEASNDATETESETEEEVVAEPEEQLLSESIANKVKGFAVEVRYPDNGKYVAELNDNILVLKNEADNMNIKLFAEESSENSFSKDKNDRAESEGFAELKAGENECYVYISGGNKAKYNIKIGNTSEGKLVVLRIWLEKLSSSGDSDLETMMASEDMQTILNNLSFDANAETFSVDGTISNDSKYYLKTIDESKYTANGSELKPETGVNGIVVTLSNDSAKTWIEIRDYKYESLEKAAEYKESTGKVLNDDEVGGIKVKYEEISDSPDKYECNRSYLVEKDGIVYQINYQVYKGMSVEDSQQLLEDIVSNLTTYTE